MIDDLIKSGCEQLALKLTNDQENKLSAYVNLLIKWNKVYNLTSIKNTKEIVIKHVLDSLSIIKYINRDNLIDIGSGAGLPGIIIAIAKPDIRVTLLDSNGKKTTFLQQVKIELNLSNVEIINQRVEEYLPQQKFDLVVTRAFASLANIIKLTKHLVSKQGNILAMKGKLLKEETEEWAALADSENEFKITQITKIVVPFLSDERHIIELIRKT